MTLATLLLALMTCVQAAPDDGASNDEVAGAVQAGDRAFAAGDLDAALGHYRDAAARDSRSADALAGQVAVFRAQKRHGKALKRAAAVAKLDPARGKRLQVEVLVDHGDALMAMGPELVTTAAARYQQAVQLAPGDRRALTRLLEALVTAARCDDVARIADSALTAETDEAERRYWHGRAREAARDLEAARAHYRASIALRPTHGDTLLHLARLAVADGRLDEARQWLERTAAHQAATPRALVLEAEVLRGLGDLEASERCLARALTLSPEHTGALYQHARILLKLGRREEGLAQMTRFRELQRAALVVDGG